MGVRRLGSVLYSLVIRIDSTKADVVSDACVEKEHMLRDDADLTTHGVETEVSDVDAIDEDLSYVRLVQTHQKMNQRALPGPVLAGQSNSLARIYL